MNPATRPASWKILLAFSVIYFVWGSTFLAIRVGVHEVPPFLLAALRFAVAGVALYGWMRLRGTPSPTLREWGGATALGTLIFLVDYGCVFWAEQRIPSGIAAVVLATIPVFMTVLEVIFLRTQQMTARLVLALLVGILGVAVLMNNSAALGEAPIDRPSVLALLVAAISWSAAAILSRSLPLPSSKPMSAAAQMLSGGIQLFLLAGISGEFSGFRVQSVSFAAWFSLLYLIVAGSLIGFTAYVWLLHYESPSKVGTYAYVNPVVAVAVGYLIGGERIGLRTLSGTLLILVSVVTITTTRARQPQAMTIRNTETIELDLPAAEAD